MTCEALTGVPSTLSAQPICYNQLCSRDQPCADNSRGQHDPWPESSDNVGPASDSESMAKGSGSSEVWSRMDSQQDSSSELPEEVGSAQVCASIRATFARPVLSVS